MLFVIETEDLFLQVKQTLIGSLFTIIVRFWVLDYEPKNSKWSNIQVKGFDLFFKERIRAAEK